MKTLTHSLASIPYFVPGTFDEIAQTGPRRKSQIRPPADEKFVLPIRQSLVMDPRIMPGTLRMLTLLAGWAGHGRPLDTNLSVIAKHLGRSVRQVQRYIKDAAEEGYLYVRQRANRLGYIVGLRICLCRAAIYAPKKECPVKGKGDRSKPFASRRSLDTTQESDTNENKSITLGKSDPFERRLAGLCERLGLEYQSSP